MPEPPIQLVIADVDGTLVTKDKLLTDRAHEAVRKLHAAGIAFTITSGRPPRGMKMLIDALELTHPIAAFNGGVIVRPDLSVLQQHFVPTTAAKSSLEIVEGCGLDAWLYTDQDWYVR